MTSFKRVYCFVHDILSLRFRPRRHIVFVHDSWNLLEPANICEFAKKFTFQVCYNVQLNLHFLCSSDSVDWNSQRVVRSR